MDWLAEKADLSNRKIRQYRKPLIINLGIIIFSVIFVYVVICVFLYFTQKHIRLRSEEWFLSIGNVYQGIALREETIVTSNDSGYINYYAREGERVGFGKLVCSIDESGQLKEMFDAGKADDTQLSDNNLADIKSEITGYMSDLRKAVLRSL